MPSIAETQQLTVWLDLNDTKFQQGLKRVEASSLGLQRQAALMRTAAADIAAARAAQASAQATGVEGLNRSLGRLRAQYGSVQAVTSATAAMQARFAQQSSAELDRAAAMEQSHLTRQARMSEQAYAKRAALSKSYWDTEMARLEASTAAQARYAAQQEATAKRITTGISKVGKTGFQALGGGLKFLERTTLAAAAAGGILELSFVKVQDQQAAFARTLTGESTAAIAKATAEVMELSKTVPLSVTELFRIAEVIGTTKVAADSIGQLTEVVAKLASTTDLSADEAAIGLARLLNMFGHIDEKGHIAAGAAEALADALFRSSIQFSSSDQEVLRASLRFGALAHMMEMTEGQVIALSGAVTGLGQEPEAVGGSFQRLFQIILKAVGQADKGIEDGIEATKRMAELAGLTSEQFATGIKTAPFETFIRMIEGFSKLSPTEQATLFGKGGFMPSFVRGAQTVQNLALSWEEVLAAAKEFDTNSGQFDKAFQERIDTIAKKFQLMVNAIVRGSVAFGEAFDEELGGAIEKVTAWITENEDAFAKWGKRVGDAIKSIDWQQLKAFVGDFIGIFSTGLKATMAILDLLGPRLVGILALVKTVNFLSGGAIGSIGGGLLSGLGGLMAKALGNAFAQAGIGKFFVQPVFVTNPGFGVGGPGAGGIGSQLAMFGVVGVALANLALLPTAIQGTLDTISGAVQQSADKLLTGIKGITDYLKVNPFTAGWAQLLELLENRIPPGATRGPQPAGGYPHLALEAAKEQMRVARYMADASKDDAVTAEQLAAASANLMDATQKWLDALKPRHRQGEVGKSKQSAEFAFLERVDPNKTDKITAALADLIAHYKEKPIGTKGHERGFVLPAFRGVFDDLKQALKAAMKRGDEGGVSKLVTQLKGLKELGIHLPPGLRRLIKKAEESQETSKETKHATQKVKNAVTDASDRIENLTAALRRKKMSVTTIVKPASVRVNNPLTVRNNLSVRVSGREVSRSGRTTTSYGPNIVFQIPGAYYGGGGGP